MFSPWEGAINCGTKLEDVSPVRVIFSESFVGRLPTAGNPCDPRTDTLNGKHALERHLGGGMAVATPPGGHQPRLRSVAQRSFGCGGAAELPFELGLLRPADDCQSGHVGSIPEAVPMADGKTHDRLGGAVGALLALLRSDAEKDAPMDVLMRVLGGYWGGRVGARIPDWLEPAVSSWHRSTAHSVVVGATIFELARRKIAAWEDHCRAKQVDALTSGNTADWLFWSLASGFGPAVAAGHISHIALDARTPRGIPFISA